MNSAIQLQEIEGVGLIVYFDNSNYYEFELVEQREKLIDKLNSYDFCFDYNKMGIDKLRTLYLGEKKYSMHQNA